VGVAPQKIDLQIFSHHNFPSKTLLTGEGGAEENRPTKHFPQNSPLQKIY
jgi:hypothetical protein